VTTAAEIEVRTDTPSASTGPALAAVWLQHGFARKPSHLEGIAQALLAAGMAVLRPALSSFSRPRQLDDPTLIAVLARRLAAEGARLAPGRPFCIVGHSAGGAAVVHGAATLTADGAPPAGLVLLDPNESLTHLMVPALPTLSDLDVMAAVAPPNRCNRKGEAAGLLAAARTGFFGVEVIRGGHCDAEGRADLVCRAACGATDPTAAATVREATVSWLREQAGEADAAGRLRPGGDLLTEWVAADRVRPLEVG
jgi:hypothetical protein